MLSFLTLFTAAQVERSQEELMMKTVSEIVGQLIQAHEQKKDINLNRLTTLS